MDDRQERQRRREGTRAEALAAQDEIAAQRRAERRAARAKEDAKRLGWRQHWLGDNLADFYAKVARPALDRDPEAWQ